MDNNSTTETNKESVNQVNLDNLEFPGFIRDVVEIPEINKQISHKLGIHICVNCNMPNIVAKAEITTKTGAYTVFYDQKCSVCGEAITKSGELVE